MSELPDANSAEHSLSIKLLGGFVLTWQGEPVAAFSNTRLQRLLAYLILHQAMPQSRQSLAQIFWPDSGDSQARTNLRNALHLLRTHLPNVQACIQSDNKTILWKEDAPATVDLLAFDAYFRAGNEAVDVAASQNAYAAAVEQYGGDLLPDCYEEWILPLREEWQQRYLQALHHLAERLEQQRKYDEAIDVAQTMLQLNSLQESSYALLMSLQAANGDRAAALQVYHDCQTMLIDELGVEPGPAIQSIYDRLLALEPTEVATERQSFGAPLIGRDDAWETLQSVWKQANQGQSAMLVISGEAGIGKSRLVEEWTTRQVRQGIPCATAHCYSAGGRLAFAPIQTWLRAPQIQQHFDRLAPHHQGELLRLLPELGNEPVSMEGAVSAVESMQRTHLFEAMAALLAQVDAPLVLVLDDIQWCDQDTLEWLEHLFQSVDQPRTGSSKPMRLLLIATLRTGEVETENSAQTLKSALKRKDQLVEIQLNRLDEAATGELIQRLTGESTNKAALAQIFADTEGNPLFVEEMVRSLAQATADGGHSLLEGQTDQLTLPPKIQSIIEARLVRLSPAARGLADVAAVLGRVFTTGLLVSVTGEDEDTLLQGLDELWQQQIIREFGQGAMLSDDAYDFAHDKLRDVVYQTLSPMRRRQLHRRAAQALEEQTTQPLAGVASQIASHCERGGQPLVAIRWYLQSAETANQLSASQEALWQLDHALQILGDLPSGTDEAAELEFAIQLRRGPLLLATRGYADPETEQALTRAWAICQSAEDVRQRFKVMWGLNRFYQVQPNFEKGRQIAGEMVALAEQGDANDLRIEAYTALGTYHLYEGQFKQAIAYLDQSLALYQPEVHSQNAYDFGQDPKVVSLVYSAWALICLGQAEEAQQRVEEALTWSVELGHAYSQVLARSYAAVQEQFLGRIEGCLHMAQSANALAKENGFRLWIATSEFLSGWSICQLAKDDPAQIQKGLELMQGSAELYRQTGAKLGACYFAGLLAETLANTGQTDGSSFMIQLALMQLAETEERWCQAELHRIHSLILAKAGDSDGAQAAHDQALQVAQEQNARWWIQRINTHSALLA